MYTQCRRSRPTVTPPSEGRWLPPYLYFALGVRRGQQVIFKAEEREAVSYIRAQAISAAFESGLRARWFQRPLAVSLFSVPPDARRRGLLHRVSDRARQHLPSTNATHTAPTSRD